MNTIACNFAKDSASAIADRSALTRAFEIVNNAIERNHYAPILANARLIGDGSTLFVTATDLDIELTVAIPAPAGSDFALTLPAAKMRDLLKKATASDFVAFTMPEIVTRQRMNRTWNNDHRDYDETPTGETYDEFTAPATIDFERVKYRLPAIVASDFPIAQCVNSNHKFTMPGAALWRAIDATIGAVSTEETRYYLRGIYIHPTDSALRLVATDGHRLYRQDLALPDGAGGMEGVILPHKAAKLLHKLLKGKACPEFVTIEASGKRLSFQWDDVTLITKTIDGTFPDYQRVIPTANDKRASFDVETMLEAIRAVSLISSERGRAIKMTLTPRDCVLSVNNPDAGTAESSIVCDYDSAPLEIGLNAGYIVDAIGTAADNADIVEMLVADASCPILIKGDREGWLGVLMPMRV